MDQQRQLMTIEVGVVLGLSIELSLIPENAAKRERDQRLDHAVEHDARMRRLLAWRDRHLWLARDWFLVSLGLRGRFIPCRQIFFVGGPRGDRIEFGGLLLPRRQQLL